MAKKRLTPFDFRSWNFVIFLTLSLMLIVGIVTALSGGTTTPVRTKAASVVDLQTVIDDCKASGGSVSWSKQITTGGSQIYLPVCNK